MHSLFVKCFWFIAHFSIVDLCYVCLPKDHSSMDAGSHYMEVVQKTRNRLESGELTKDELDKSMMVCLCVSSWKVFSS